MVTPPRPPRRRRAPVRTCVGCRGRAERSQLLRLVVAVGDGPVSVVPDPGACLPGRGAWVHPDLACHDLAVRRRALPRALRVQGPVSTEAVRLLLEERGRSTTEPSSSTGSGYHQMGTR